MTVVTGMSVYDQGLLARETLNNRNSLGVVSSAWYELKNYCEDDIDLYVLALIADRAVVRDVRDEAARMLASKRERPLEVVSVAA